MARGLLQSTPLRLLLALVALFTLVSLASLAVSYFVARTTVDQTIRSGLRQELAGFRAAPTGIAVAQLVQAQGQAMNPAEKIVGYTDRFGRHFGNGGLVRTREGFEVVALDGEETAGTYFALTERIHGGYLTLAASADARAALRQTFLTVLGLSILPTAAIALGGGVLLARRSARRLEGLEATLGRLTSGDLSARVPAMPGRADDLTRIGARVDAMAAAQEANVEALRQVSADIAHDLKTPVQRLAVLLERAAEEQGDTTELLEQANAETRGIVETFQALLQIAQIDGGGTLTEPRPMDLGDLAETVHDLYAPTAEAEGHTIACRITDPATASGNRTLLAQLLSNLVENALRHAGPAAEVTIAVDGRTLSVSDRGPGIPEGERHKVLRRLYRLESSRSTPGNGLGLSLVRAIADHHGATLTLADNAPGLRVSVTFPSTR